VHGANRLASNSLLDGLVFGSRIIEAIAAGKDGPEQSGALRGVTRWAPGEMVPPLAGGPDGRDDLQRVLTRDAGVLRDEASLAQADAALGAMHVEGVEDANLLTVGRALVAAARARCESRGTHTRLDFPERADRFDGRLVFSHGFDPTLVPLPSPEPASSTS
jgi:L-aspartate oxidase